MLDEEDSVAYILHALDCRFYERMHRHDSQ
jgi:hypothetical protein